MYLASTSTIFSKGANSIYFNCKYEYGTSTPFMFCIDISLFSFLIKFRVYSMFFRNPIPVPSTCISLYFQKSEMTQFHLHPMILVTVHVQVQWKKSKFHHVLSKKFFHCELSSTGPGGTDTSIFVCIKYRLWSQQQCTKINDESDVALVSHVYTVEMSKLFLVKSVLQIKVIGVRNV